MKEKISKICNNKYIQVWILLGALVCSILFEFTFGNWNYYFQDFKGIEKENTITYEAQNDQYIVSILNINKFVNELEIDIEIDSTENIEYVSYYNVSGGEYMPIQQETLFLDQEIPSVIRIGKEVDSIQLVFSNCKEENIKVNGVTSINEFEINYIAILVLFVLIYLILDFICYCFKKERLSLHLYFLKISLLFGILYALLNPMYYALDEKEHMVRSYNIAEGNFIKVKGDKVLYSIGLQNIIDNPQNIYVASTYRGFTQNLSYLSKQSEQEEAFVSHDSTAEPYLFFAYLISGLGMFVGRILHFSFPVLFYLGRFCNVIFYALVVSLAIKFSGKYGKLVFLIGCLPYFFFQSASYSADMLTNAMSLLAISLALHYRNGTSKVGFKETLLLLIVCSLSYASKVAYFPIVLTIFLIPNKQFKSRKFAYYSKALLCLSGLVGFGICYFYANKIGIVQWSIPNVDSSAQLRFILSNPLQYVHIIYNTFQTGFVSMLVSSTSQLGYCGDLGNINLFLILLSFVFVCATTYDAPELSLFCKCILLVLILFCIGTSITAIYMSFNAVGATYVNGYQGRYLAPLLFPTLLLFCSPRFQLDMNKRVASGILILMGLFFNIYSILLIFKQFFY